jgi:hypothetical protein
LGLNLHRAKSQKGTASRVEFRNQNDDVRSLGVTRRSLDLNDEEELERTVELSHWPFIGAETGLIQNIKGTAAVAGLDGDELRHLLTPSKKSAPFLSTGRAPPKDAAGLMPRTERNSKAVLIVVSLAGLNRHACPLASKPLSWRRHTARIRR